MAEDTWIKDETRHAVVDVGGPVGSDRSGSSDGFKPSPKLRARIQKLAKWRIDPANISLWNGSEYHGGHATVSRGGLARKSLTTSSWFMSNVAVKKMRVADDTDFERILGLTIREAEFLAERDHKNIVKLEGFVEDVSKGIIWLVFPWAEYGNLKDFIAREKWDIPERISLINDVAKGLDDLHTRNPPICHGDLKSLNVLIDRDLEWTSDKFPARQKIYARITDFGSARRLPRRDPDTQVDEVVAQLPPAQSPSAAFCASTKTITLTGNNYTLRWAAPELLLHDQLSLWSDIWALGWICYEVMTGSLPFEDAASETAVVERVVEGKLPSLTDNAHLSLIHELCSLMSMCWELKPSQRPTADSCRRSIGKMPMFTPAIGYHGRVLEYHHLRQLGQMYQSRGEYAKAFAFFVDSATGQFLLEHRAQGLRDIAQLARLSKEYSGAIAAYDVILKIYEEDPLRGLAHVHRRRSEYEQAIPLNPKVLGLRKNLCDVTGRALWGLAYVHQHQSEYEQAIPPYSKVLKIRKNLLDRKGRADAPSGLADAHRMHRRYQREYEQWISVSPEILQIHKNLRDRKGRTDAMCGLADAHRLRRQYEQALPLYHKALGICTSIAYIRGEAGVVLGFATTHHDWGDLAVGIRARRRFPYLPFIY